jgi:hypothetical protein
MKTLLAVSLAGLTVLAAGCQTAAWSSRPIVYSGGDGSSRERAVVISEVACREAGVLAENLWLEQRYPGCRGATRSAVNGADKQYDVVEFATAGGETRKVYFDTTEVGNR